MSVTKRTSVEDTYRVATSMDESGRMVVRPLGRFDELEVVGYADELVAERLSALSAGASVRLDLSPASTDEDAYVVTRVRPGTGLAAL